MGVEKGKGGTEGTEGVQNRRGGRERKKLSLDYCL